MFAIHISLKSAVNWSKLRLINLDTIDFET